MPGFSLRDSARKFAEQISDLLNPSYRTAPNGQATVVEQIVRDNPGAVMAIAEVQRIAASMGHDYDNEQVRNTLSYMGRKGLVTKGNTRGTWVFPGANDFGPAMLAGPREASEGDDSMPGAVFAGATGTSQPVG